MMTDNSEFVFFWRTSEDNGCFSQWYQSAFVADGNTFTTMEQYMMYKKAELFDDHGMMHKILNTPDAHPAKHKKIGRLVKNFDAKKWDDESSRIVTIGSCYKFRSSDKLRKKLLATGDKTIVEASPCDRTGRIGFEASNAMPNITQWGENKLGKALMMARTKMVDFGVEEWSGETEVYS